MRFSSLAGLAAAGLVVAACASNSSSTTETTSPAASTAVVTSVTPSPAQPVPPNTLPLTDDSTASVTVGPTSSTPPTPDQITFTPIGQVSNPVDLAYRTGDNAFYIVSQDGFIVALRNGTIGETRLLDISGDIASGGEQGLLGLTFSTDGSHAYVDYTNPKGDTEITEYAVSADGVFDPGSKRVLLKIDQPFANHNGGQVRIGPDGYLYIGMGDGGDSGDPKRNGLNRGRLLGKLLRIDPTPSHDQPYTIPADNPFVGVKNSKPEIWSVGLRNPWRFSFDRATNDLWIADVGQDAWEEIDVAWAEHGAGRGANFGWSAFEGTHRYNNDQSADGAVSPIYEYAHGPAGCSVSGGVRYRGTAIPSLSGWYVYGDYCSGEVRAFPVLADRTAGAEVTLTASVPGISEVAQGPDGELYVLSVEQDEVLAVRPAA